MQFCSRQQEQSRFLALAEPLRLEELVFEEKLSLNLGEEDEPRREEAQDEFPRKHSEQADEVDSQLDRSHETHSK